MAETNDSAATPEKLQLHLVLPYKVQPRENERIRGWLVRGYRVTHLQRVSDREAVVTLVRPASGDAAG